MRFLFKDFEFDTSSLVLSQQGEPVTIRHNEAKVLALLLENKSRVLSKEDILAHVWQDKVVSDQAVFQNISHLRNLLGNDAIKTFPKRGYQWQLDVKVADDAVQPSVHSESSSSESSSVAPVESAKPAVSPAPSFSMNRLLAGALAGVALILLLVVFTRTPAPDSAQTQSGIAYVPITSAITGQGGEQRVSLSDTQSLDFTELSGIDRAHYEASLELEYQKLSVQHPLILTGHLREHNQRVYFDFSLKGPADTWLGQLVAGSQDEVMAAFFAHIEQDFILELVSDVQSPDVKLATLSIAHQRQPDDLIILNQLINSYMSTRELDKAMPLTDKLIANAQAQGNEQQVGHAFLLQGKILNIKQLYALSAYKIAQAVKSFEQVGDLARQADAWASNSWLDLQLNDYKTMKASLLKSAELAIAQQDIERELHALTYLSVLAHKQKQHQDKYLYLTQAEEKMREYELPIYRFAKIPFHHAIYTDNPSGKEPHLKRVLEYTELTPDHWVAQSSRSQLMHHYIEQNRLEDAKALVDSLASDNAQNSYLKTLFARASNNPDDTMQYAQRTFEQAQLAGERRISLDVALMLCSSPELQVDYDFYRQYINENATSGWRRDNQEELLALNF